jgi:hypothetical protein
LLTLLLVAFAMPVAADEPNLDVIVYSDFVPEPLPVPIGVEFALLSDGTVFYQDGSQTWGELQMPRWWIGRIALAERDALLREIGAKLNGLDGTVSRCPEDRDICARLCEMLKADFPSSKACLGFTHDAPSATIRYRSSDDGAWHSVGVFGYPIRASTNYYTAPDAFAEVYRSLERFSLPDAREWRDGQLRLELVDMAGYFHKLAVEWPAQWPKPAIADVAILCAPQSSLDDETTWNAILARYVRDRDDPDRIWYVGRASLDLPAGIAEAIVSSPKSMDCP